MTDRILWPLVTLWEHLAARVKGPRCHFCLARTRWQATHERYDHAGDVDEE